MVVTLSRAAVWRSSCSRQLRSARALSTKPFGIPALVGSAPVYPRHLILHVPQKVADFPSHLESTSKLYAELGKRWGKHEVLSKLGFGVAEGDGEAVQKWDSSRSRFEQPEGQEEESYEATLYPDFIPVPSSISLSTLASFESFYLGLPSPSPPSAAFNPSTPRRADIYVCTHGSRDCRCADLGEPLYQALVKEVARRKLGECVKVRRVGHVGGHKWAGNALVYRNDGRGDWYGLLRDTDARELVEYATAEEGTPWYARWRGQLGLSSEEVREAYVEGTTGAAAPKRKEKARNALGDPVELVFKSWDNQDEWKVIGYEGESLMETARRHDLPSILATCGGHCECATCHVHIIASPPLSTAAPTQSTSGRLLTPVPSAPAEAPLPEMTDEEDEQLEFAMGADDDSRLACQLPVTKELGEWVKGGGRVRLPRY